MKRPNNAVDTDSGWLVNIDAPAAPWPPLMGQLPRQGKYGPSLVGIWGRFSRWPKQEASHETKQFFAGLKEKRKDQFRLQKMQTGKKQTRYVYNEGPLLYIGQKIVRAMQDAGYPARIYEHWRSPAQQTLYYEKGTTKAKPWQSAHQYGEAVDILHPTKAWSVTNEYWDALARCVNVVEQQLDVKLTHGWRDWGWDGPHVQLPDFRTIPAYAEKRRPTQEEMDARFAQVLPNVWKTRPVTSGREEIDLGNGKRLCGSFELVEAVKKMLAPK
ncbi:M15 family metallopeptidase domain-containing protein [Maritimibacter alexandrii]|uniref:M15 family metallopeptidase n=1 Tax=Maritimibacter alexandrii TaxID=2570355 RepID=UPI00110887D1|nr:M15 family metallopeptidase [Maritimibacter alexandrii]